MLRWNSDFIGLVLRIAQRDGILYSVVRLSACQQKETTNASGEFLR